MVKQEKAYIKNKKKHHMVRGLIWLAVLLAIFITGLVVTKVRGNYFTLVAAVLVLPVSLHITRYISYAKYRDPSGKRSHILEQMKGTYHLYHSCIIPDVSGNLFFDHIVITSRNIYFLSSQEEIIAKAKPVLALRLKSKGIADNKLHYICVNGSKATKNASLKMEKDACYSSENLESTSRIIEGMLM